MAALHSPHTHWLVPILSDRADLLATRFWHHGFDGTRGSSVLFAVPPPPDRPDLIPREARKLMDRILYLPIYPGIAETKIRRLGRIVSEFEEKTDTEGNAPPVKGREAVR